MKKIILVIAVLFAINISFAQNFNELANYEFDTTESYSAEEDKVLSAANYLFSNPANVMEQNRLIAIGFIMKWMEGTADYTFEIGDQTMELTKGNSDLLGMYLAAMSKVVLENEGSELSKDEIFEESKELLVAYCADSKNKMKPSKAIKKIIKSRKN